jgi:hypothetical protein
MAGESAPEEVLAETRYWIVQSREWIAHTRQLAIRLHVILPATGMALRAIADDVEERLGALPAPPEV